MCAQKGQKPLLLTPGKACLTSLHLASCKGLRAVIAPLRCQAARNCRAESKPLGCCMRWVVQKVRAEGACKRGLNVPAVTGFLSNMGVSFPTLRDCVVQDHNWAGAASILSM